MSSWRDTTPPAVQDDLDGLLSAALETAQQLLTKNGEFLPFAIAVASNGDIGMVAADPGLGEQPASVAVLDRLYAGAASNRDAYRVAGFVAQGAVNGGDAIRIESEHRDGGPPIVALMPFARKGLFKKTMTYGDMTAGAGERRIWTEG